LGLAFFAKYGHLMLHSLYNSQLIAGAERRRLKRENNIRLWHACSQQVGSNSLFRPVFFNREFAVYQADIENGTLRNEPDIQLQSRNPAEVTGIVGNQDKTVFKCCGGNKNVCIPDEFPASVQVRVNVCCLYDNTVR
jgi:hypothetical protein